MRGKYIKTENTLIFQGIKNTETKVGWTKIVEEGKFRFSYNELI